MKKAHVTQSKKRQKESVNEAFTVESVFPPKVSD